MSFTAWFLIGFFVLGAICILSVIFDWPKPYHPPQEHCCEFDSMDVGM